MTKEELKNTYSMKDVIGKYGLFPNRAGFVSCPFHYGDHTASLKIYKDSFYCFGCGASGDIFDFVMRMERCDFKTAFEFLGGTYQKPTFSSRLAIYQSQKKMQMREKEKQREEDIKSLNIAKISLLQDFLNKSEPLSNVWCDCYNLLQKELYRHSILNGLESRW
jgi:DNA primase